MSFSGECLFKGQGLQQALDAQRESMFKEIMNYEANPLLNTSIDDLLDYFEQKYGIEPLVLKRDEATVEQSETEIDVSRSNEYDVRDRDRSYFLPGTEIRYHLPFEGDQSLFSMPPSAVLWVDAPSATVNEHDIVLSYKVLEHNVDQLKHQYESDVARIMSLIQNQKSEIEQFNNSINELARGKIEWRRDKLLKDQRLVESLGVPLRKRSDSASMMITKEIRRKIQPIRPPASDKSFKPECSLEMEQYDDILRVIENMAKVMERSPKTFAKLYEEEIRNHFLVQLNGIYEGFATAETFNFEGKTDILIRYEGKNLFIAECKFWKGTKSMTETIDQLLRYTSWRDTKTAILLFNRKKDFSRVLGEIPVAVKSHPNFKRQLKYNLETGFRFQLHHCDDVNRELFLTVLAFEVPC